MIDPAPIHETGQRIPALESCPVSTSLASLHRERNGIQEPLTFDVVQLVDAVEALDSPSIEAPVFGRDEPQPGAWGTPFNLEGRSTAPGGRRLTAPFLASAEDLRCGLLVRLAAVEVSIRGGESLEVPLDLRQAPADVPDQR